MQCEKVEICWHAPASQPLNPKALKLSLSNAPHLQGVQDVLRSKSKKAPKASAQRIVATFLGSFLECFWLSHRKPRQVSELIGFL